MLAARCALLFALAAAAAPSAQAALPNALEGSWYSPLQSGHGLTLERIDADSALLFWHVFDPDGRPLTLYIEAAVEGDHLIGEAYAPVGMRFGSFDPAQFLLPRWGSIRIDFADCGHATLRYDSALPDYGRGELPLVRLLPLRDADCSLADPAGLASFAGFGVRGEIHGKFDPASLPAAAAEHLTRYESDLLGHVDAEGAIWAGASYGYGYPNNAVLIGLPKPAVGGEARSDVAVYANGWLNPILQSEQPANASEPVDVRYPPNRRDDFALSLATRAERGARGQGFPSAQRAGAPDLRVELAAGERRVGSGLPSQGARLYFQMTDLYFDGSDWQTRRLDFVLNVSPQLQLCLRRELNFLPVGDCLFDGQLTATAPGLYRFRLQQVGSDAPAFEGSAISVNAVAGPPTHPISYFQMIGSNGETGLYLESGNSAAL